MVTSVIIFPGKCQIFKNISLRTLGYSLRPLHPLYTGGR